MNKYKSTNIIKTNLLRGNESFLAPNYFDYQMWLIGWFNKIYGNKAYYIVIRHYKNINSISIKRRISYNIS